MSDAKPGYETLRFELDGWTFEARYAWDVQRGGTYFHMTAGKSSEGLGIKVCGPVEVDSAVEDDAVQAAHAWLASVKSSERKKVSSVELSNVLSDELTAIAGARVLPPIIERRDGAMPNWVVQMPRDAAFKEAVERVMSQYDLE